MNGVYQFIKAWKIPFLFLLALLPFGFLYTTQMSCRAGTVLEEPDIDPYPSWTPDEKPTYRPKPGRKSGSVGSPNDGHLINGIRLEPRPGIRLNNPERSWGTLETVELVNHAFDKMLEQYPETCDLFVGDISVKNGGRLKPHISHQSGRDIDVGLYAKGNKFVYFINFTEDNLDVAKTWYFIETLLLTDRVQMILLDYKLQKVLYEYLKPIYPKRKLAKYIQYPRKLGERGGIIRHARSHQNHLHIRFKCPEGDYSCKDW